MVLSPKKYVLLRAKVLEMNSKSLEVDDAEEHGLQRRGTRTEHGAKACVKNGESPAARGSSCVLERGCFMSKSSLVKVCGDDLVMRTSHQGERCFSLTSSKTDRARMGAVHPGAPRPWLYLISERRARAPGAGVETEYPSAATYYHEAVTHRSWPAKF